MKVYVYARVSTDDQNVLQQSKYAREWARKKGYVVLGTINDKESGTLPLTNRLSFARLLQKCVEEKANLVIYNLDRLTRNWDDVTYIEKVFRENWNDCKLISTSDPIDLENASGRLMFRIRMATSCYMPEDMREKQVIGIERAKKEGKYKGRPKGAKNKK